jgi:hypothetical protein
MARKYKNNASSTLAGALGVNTTTLTVATGHGDRFPVASGADYFKLTLQKSGGMEIVKVTSRVASSDSMTIERAQEGTTALSFSIGDIVSLRATADSYNSIDAHIESTTAAHSASAIANIPAGGISATNVQAALNELDSEKEPAGAVAAHVAAADPHPQYLTSAEGNAAYQPLNANLTAESNLTGAANKLPYYTGAGAKALTDLTAFSRTLLDDPDAATARTTIGALSSTNPVITGSITEGVYAISGTTPALNPINGTIQTWTLTANSTPTDGLASGQFLTLMINDGTAYTITWPTMTWVGGTAPTLATSGYTVVELWKVGTTLYGALVGSVA